MINHATDQAADQDASIKDLVSRLTENTGKLVRDEFQLAKLELRHNAQRLGIDAAVIAAGGVVALIGALDVVAGATMLLGKLMPRWLAALAMGGALIGGGYYLIEIGQRALGVASQDTMQSLKDDAALMR